MILFRNITVYTHTYIIYTHIFVYVYNIYFIYVRVCGSFERGIINLDVGELNKNLEQISFLTKKEIHSYSLKCCLL